MFVITESFRFCLSVVSMILDKSLRAVGVVTFLFIRELLLVGGDMLNSFVALNIGVLMSNYSFSSNSFNIRVLPSETVSRLLTQFLRISEAYLDDMVSFTGFRELSYSIISSRLNISGVLVKHKVGSGLILLKVFGLSLGASYST